MSFSINNNQAKFASDPGLSLLPNDRTLTEEIAQLALQWKHEHVLIPAADKALTRLEQAKVAETCRYPAFADLLKGSKQVRSDFFEWMLQDCNDVQPFIEFPAVCARLKAVKLSCRIGRLGSEMLSIVQRPMADGKFKKVIRLPFFDGKQIKHVNILDENKKVQLNGNRTITIKEIFEIFSNKDYDDGDVEMFGTRGIMNWDLKKVSYWDFAFGKRISPNFNHESWWVRLPALEKISKAETERRYDVSLNEGQWIRAARANRSKIEMTLPGSHAFIEMAIPLDDGQYGIYPFGKFLREYPRNMAGDAHFALTGKTALGDLVYPDPNPFYSDRQQGLNVEVLTPELGKLWMKQIKEDILASRQDQVTFELAGNSCAAWTQNTLVKIEGPGTHNFFKLPIMEVIEKTIVKMPLRAWNFYTSMLRLYSITQRVVTTLMPSLKQQVAKDCMEYFKTGIYIKIDGKQVFRSITDSDDFQNNLTHQSSTLVERIAAGKVPGRIFFGHGFYR